LKGGADVTPVCTVSRFKTGKGKAENDQVNPLRTPLGARLIKLVC